MLNLSFSSKNNLYTLLFFSLISLTLQGCLKDKEKDKEITIQGTLLESSSHPVPVAGYKLSFLQSGGGSFILGGASGGSANCITDANGHFKTHFALGSSFFLVFQSTNQSPLFVSGDENVKYNLHWLQVQPVSENLSDMYLFKKVSSAILQLTVDTVLSPSDTIEVSAYTTEGRYHKVITGISIAPGVPTNFDTIPNKISTFYTLTNKTYSADINVLVTRQNFKWSTDYYPSEPAGDEDSKVYELSSR